MLDLNQAAKQRLLTLKTRQRKTDLRVVHKTHADQVDVSGQDQGITNHAYAIKKNERRSENGKPQACYKTTGNSLSDGSSEGGE